MIIIIFTTVLSITIRKTKQENPVTLVIDAGSSGSSVYTTKIVGSGHSNKKIISSKGGSDIDCNYKSTCEIGEYPMALITDLGGHCSLTYPKKMSVSIVDYLIKVKATSIKLYSFTTAGLRTLDSLDVILACETRFKKTLRNYIIAAVEELPSTFSST